MKRYEKFVYEDEKKGTKYEKKALEGSFFEFSEGTSGELIIRLKAVQTKKVAKKTKGNVATKTVHTKTVVNKTKGNVTTKTAKNDNRGINYKNPPIPKGYKHICGEWNNGFVIKRETDGSQFVWVPVGSLDANGTLDGVSFTEKFGRRNYRNNGFSEGEFHETLTGQLALQQESVKKYGGFYISRYNISRSLEGKPQSVKGVMPWVNIDFNYAKNVASTIEDSETVKSHLTFGAEYDSVLEWFIKSNARTRSEIAKDSTNWGNHWNTENPPRRVVETGSREKWCTNNIYDFAGNVDEWTQEKCKSSYRVIRGGCYFNDGGNYPVAYRFYCNPNIDYDDTGFRATLYIK